MKGECLSGRQTKLLLLVLPIIIIYGGIIDTVVGPGCELLMIIAIIHPCI